MSRCSYSGTVFFTLCLVSASALVGDSHEPKLDKINKDFAKAQSEIKSIIHESEKEIDPEADTLKTLTKTVKYLEQASLKPNPAVTPKNPRSTASTSFYSMSEGQDKPASIHGNIGKDGQPKNHTSLDPSSIAQVEDESDEDEESLEDEGENEDENADGDEDDGDEENGQEQEGKEEDEEEEDENEDEDGEDDKDSKMQWGKVLDESGAKRSSLMSNKWASLISESGRKLIGAREEHRRRGVSDMPFPTPPVMEAESSQTTTTTGKYPLGYIGPGHEAVEKEYHDKWAVMPDPEGREMTKVWAFDHPIDWHEHAWDGKPGKCEGRRRISTRRRVCQKQHRRRRGHRRRRSHHRRRAHEYRRRRRRVHRRRRISKDTSHRRRSHRRRLERGDSAATAKMANRKAQRQGGGNAADASESQKAAGGGGGGESLIERNSTQVNGDKGMSTLAVDGQGESVLMRRHNFDS